MRKCCTPLFWSLFLGVKLHLQVPWLSNLFSHNAVSSALFVIQEISQLQRTQTSKAGKQIWGMGAWGHQRRLFISIRKLFSFFLSLSLSFFLPFYTTGCKSESDISAHNFESPHIHFQRCLDTSLSFHKKFSLPDKTLFYQLLMEEAFLC